MILEPFTASGGTAIAAVDMDLLFKNFKFVVGLTADVGQQMSNMLAESKRMKIVSISILDIKESAKLRAENVSLTKGFPVTENIVAEVEKWIAEDNIFIILCHPTDVDNFPDVIKDRRVHRLRDCTNEQDRRQFCNIKEAIKHKEFIFCTSLSGSRGVDLPGKSAARVVIAAGWGC